MSTLREMMDYGCPVTVHPDGTVTQAPDGYDAPGLLDDELDSPCWEFASAGYTRQDSYNGPVMHDSERVGGALERDILAEPGVYCKIEALYAESEDGYISEGWAVVRLLDCEDASGTSHSADRVAVWHGTPSPKILCGKHAAPPITF